MLVAAGVVLGAYVLGTFPTATLVGRRFGFDPRAGGSGNPGASNAFRLGGRTAGAFVLLGDLSKGVAAAGAGALLGGTGLALSAGAAAIVGHVFPVTRGLRGGKGVATAAGVMLVVEPLAAAGGAGTWAIVLAVTRTAALSSLGDMLAALVAVLALRRPGWELGGFAGLAVLIAVRHRGNLVRSRSNPGRSISEEPS
ncbi:MAG: glycerol-3-phosphate acyltransferase [Acidimicrobiales bacterium]